jgi:hypothetical protein
MKTVNLHPQLRQVHVQVQKQSRINPECASQSAVLQRIHINKGSRIWKQKHQQHWQHCR